MIWFVGRSSNFQPTLSSVAEPLYLHLRERPVLKLRWWDVFRFQGLEARRAAPGHMCSTSRLLMSDYLHIFWSVSCVEGLSEAECSRDCVCPRTDNMWMYPSCFGRFSQPSGNLKKLGGISGCVGFG